MTARRKTRRVCAGGTRVDAAVPPPGCALSEDAAEIRSADPPPWFKRRGYPHFDRPINANQAVQLATNPTAVAHRAFLPFLAFEIHQRRYKVQPDGSRVLDVKRRPVAFASHADAAIFSYYAHLLRQPYEAALLAADLGDNVIAYRRFQPAKCNIHFANEAFAEIERRGDCVAIALDIEQFFDSIPHGTLKRLWTQMLGTPQLPPDHYAVYKTVTRWAKADRDQVFKTLGIGRRRSENWQYPNTLCPPNEFRDRIRAAGLIVPGYESRDGKTMGVPQGSPISAILSNLVMLDADTAIAGAARARGVYYRRYSDDLLLIGPEADVAAVEAVLQTAMKQLDLIVNDLKTKRVTFTRSADGLLDSTAPLQYLGFTFDGRRVLVRPQTVSKFIQRMKRSVDSAKRAATAAGKRGGHPKLRRQELYARYSHLGPTAAMRTRASMAQLRNNFYTYARRSARVMGRDEIKKQLRKHWARLNAEIQLADERS